MKKRNKIILITVLIIISVLIVSYIANFIWDSTKCSYWNKEACDLSCNQDSDCKESGCTCINKDETMSFTKGGMNIAVNCIRYSCKCENNKCSTTRWTGE